MMFFRKKDNTENNRDVILLVGLGNIGKEYEKTRHNAGFIFVEELALRHKGNWKKSKFSADICDINISGKKIILAKPTTLMNLSGIAVQKLLSFYKIPLENLFIAYDDIDINIGKIRVRESGSAGTHNGMKSIIKEIGSKDFPRIRLGIGPKPEYGDMVRFVLGKFSVGEMKALDIAVNNAIELIELTAEKNLQLAMNEVLGNKHA